MHNKSKPIFIQIPIFIYESDKFSLAEKAILYLIWSYYSSELPLFASNKYISNYAKVSTMTVKRTLKKLDDLGIITRVTTKRRNITGAANILLQYTAQRTITLNEMALMNYCNN